MRFDPRLLQSVLSVDFASLLARNYYETKYKMELTGAGHVRHNASNPGGSGKLVVFRIFDVISSVPATADIVWRRNATSGLPASAKTSRNMMIGDSNKNYDQSVMVLNADTSLTTPLGGGVDMGTWGVPGGRLLQDYVWIAVEPGASVGHNIQFGGAATVHVLITHFEIPYSL